MKKLIALFVTVILCFSGCKKAETKLAVDEAEFTKDFFAGVIVTTGQKEKSYICYYDKELELLNTQELSYGMVGDTFTDVTVKDGTLYATAQGLDQKKNTGLLLGVNLEDGKVDTFPHNLVGPAAHVEDEKFLYVCNNLNFISNIVQIDKTSGEQKKVEVDVHNITNLVSYQNQLYAFGMDYEEDGTISSYILIFDDSLNLKKKIDITEDGNSSYQAIIVDEKLYFSLITTSQNEPSNKIGVLDLTNLEVSMIELDNTYPFDMVCKDSKIYISHYPFGEQTGRITVLDLAAGEQIVYELEHPVMQMAIKDNMLIMPVDNMIYMYEIDGENIVLKKQSEGYNPPDGTKYKYYFSGVFSS